MPSTEYSARRTAALLTGLVLGSTLIAYGTERSVSVAGTPAPGVREPAPEQVWAGDVLGRMTLEQKVGQLFVTIVYGERANASDKRNRTEFGVPSAADVVAKYHLGGVIYFNWTSGLSSPRQIAELSNGLQQAAVGSGAGVPLLISTDQENGAVVRTGPPTTLLPTAGALGAAGSVADAQTAAEISGRELRAMGINHNLAPVADVNLSPDNPVLGERTFSADPQVAAAMTGAQVTGYQQSVVATAKHFPGHGASATDSHVGLPVIHHDRAEWDRLEAPPFHAAVAAGVGVMMIGHIALPKLDPSGQPATISPVLVDGLLRQELGFDGVVMTDSLRMEGVRSVAPDGRIAVLALAAGADLLLMPADLDLAYRSVLAAVRSGELTEQRLDASVQRVLELKWRSGIVAQPLVDLAELDTVGSAAHVQRVNQLAARPVAATRYGR